MSAKIPRLRRWKIEYKEQGSDDIHETSMTGCVDMKFIIDWFGLDDPEVTWYRVTEIE